MTPSEQKTIDSALEIINSKLKKTVISMTSAELVKDYLRLQLELLESEVFCVLFLNSQNQLIEYRPMFYGTIDGAAVYPREVAKAALQLNAAAIIVAHNHPSGMAQESSADRRITSQLKQALELFDIRLLDHFIVANGTVLSFAEKGLI